MNGFLVAYGECKKFFGCSLNGYHHLKDYGCSHLALQMFLNIELEARLEFSL